MSTKQPTPKEEGPRSFGHFLLQVAQGDAERELSAELRDLNKALAEAAYHTGGKAKGSLTLKLNLTVDGAHVAIGYEVSSKAPKRKTPTSIFYLSKGHNLQLDNPKQQALPGIREVPIAPLEEREIPDEDRWASGGKEV